MDEYRTFYSIFDYAVLPVDLVTYDPGKALLRKTTKEEIKRLSPIRKDSLKSRAHDEQNAQEKFINNLVRPVWTGEVGHANRKYA